MAWYLIQDGTTAEFLASNPTNALEQKPLAFFSLVRANSDQFQHLQHLPGGKLLFEDLAYGGDSDFNDLGVQIKFNI